MIKEGRLIRRRRGKQQVLRSRATRGEGSGSDWDTVERHGGLDTFVDEIDQAEE